MWLDSTYKMKLSKKLRSGEVYYIKYKYCQGVLHLNSFIQGFYLLFRLTFN